MATMNISFSDPTTTRRDVGGQWTLQQCKPACRDQNPMDQDMGQAIKALQEAITQGMESGEPLPFDPVAFKLMMRERPIVK